MWALLPLKDFSGAKQRLSAVLTPTERSGLFLAMVRDVLSVLQTHPDVDNTLIVSDAAEAGQLANDYGAQWLSEADLKVSGLNGAIQAGVGELARRGIDDVMIIHGDLPLISSADIRQLFHAHQQQLLSGHKAGAFNAPSALTISPDERREGSNCLMCTPASSMTYRYGKNSFALHSAEARKIGMPLRVVYTPGAACDIDTPQDLGVLLQRATPHNARYSHRYIKEHALVERLRTKAPVLEKADALSDTNTHARLETQTRAEPTAGLEIQYGWAG